MSVVIVNRKYSLGSCSGMMVGLFIILNRKNNVDHHLLSVFTGREIHE